MARARSEKGNDSSANLGFEAKLWLAADKLRSNMDAAEYKHTVLGLIFLNYISDSFEEHHANSCRGAHATRVLGSATPPILLWLNTPAQTPRTPTNIKPRTPMRDETFFDPTGEAGNRRSLELLRSDTLFSKGGSP
jgi:hypothetical protein